MATVGIGTRQMSFSRLYKTLHFRFSKWIQCRFEMWSDFMWKNAL